MKKLALFLLVLVFSCEKETCKLCKTKVFMPGKEAIITTEIVCYDVQEGTFVSLDSTGAQCLKMVVCDDNK